VKSTQFIRIKVETIFGTEGEFFNQVRKTGEKKMEIEVSSKCVYINVKVQGKN
jgi:hypothetical protein